jgi:hypothetical protein
LLWRRRQFLKKESMLYSEILSSGNASLNLLLQRRNSEELKDHYKIYWIIRSVLGTFTRHVENPNLSLADDLKWKDILPQNLPSFFETINQEAAKVVCKFPLDIGDIIKFRQEVRELEKIIRFNLEQNPKLSCLSSNLLVGAVFQMADWGFWVSTLDTQDCERIRSIFDELPFIHSMEEGIDEE